MMMTLFKKVRQNLLEKNKMRNYFKYALGEIILVVLGILIALQVNNWNEDRKKLHEEKAIVEGLKSEFESAKKEIIADIEDRNKSNQVVMSTLERHTGKNLTKIPQDSVKYFLDELMQYRFYTPSHPVLDDLQSSGRFNLIKSEELRFLIRDYIQTKERIKMPEEKERRFVLEQMTPFLSERIALGKLFESDQYDLDSEKLDHLMNDEFFGSLLYIRKNTIKSSQLYSRILLKNIEKIELELNKNHRD